MFVDKISHMIVRGIFFGIVVTYRNFLEKILRLLDYVLCLNMNWDFVRV
jgi:hypothetical protein